MSESKNHQMPHVNSNLQISPKIQNSSSFLGRNGHNIGLKKEFPINSEEELSVKKKMKNLEAFEDFPAKNYNNYQSCESLKWFSLDNIHEREKQAMPEFFNGKCPSKTPKIYKLYRNFIVKLNRKNPRIYLTATCCRRNLAGDACSIIRLYNFLDNNGIINFNYDPKTRVGYKLFEPSRVLGEKDNSSGHILYNKAESFI